MPSHAHPPSNVPIACIDAVIISNPFHRCIAAMKRNASGPAYPKALPVPSGAPLASINRHRRHAAMRSSPSRPIPTLRALKRLRRHNPAKRNWMSLPRCSHRPSAAGGGVILPDRSRNNSASSHCCHRSHAHSRCPPPSQRGSLAICGTVRTLPRFPLELYGSESEITRDDELGTKWTLPAIASLYQSLPIGITGGNRGGSV